jgi:hypothetical protein
MSRCTCYVTGVWFVEIGLRDGGATGMFSRGVVNKSGDRAESLVDVGHPVNIMDW